jgi:hypothetical protein
VLTPAITAAGPATARALPARTAAPSTDGDNARLRKYYHAGFAADAPQGHFDALLADMRRIVV